MQGRKTLPSFLKEPVVPASGSFLVQKNAPSLFQGEGVLATLVIEFIATDLYIITKTFFVITIYKSS
jgi:hypothetical protein